MWKSSHLKRANIHPHGQWPTKQELGLTSPFNTLSSSHTAFPQTHTPWWPSQSMKQSEPTMSLFEREIHRNFNTVRVFLYQGYGKLIKVILLHILEIAYTLTNTQIHYKRQTIDSRHLIYIHHIHKACEKKW